MDFVTGARMHACIAAFSSGVPVVPMAYSRKFNGLFSSLNYTFYVDGRADTTDIAYHKIIDGYERRDELKLKISSGNEIADKKLKPYEDYLVTLLSN